MKPPRSTGRRLDGVPEKWVWKKVELPRHRSRRFPDSLDLLLVDPNVQCHLLQVGTSPLLSQICRCQVLGPIEQPLFYEIVLACIFWISWISTTKMCTNP